jgi:hypothetical protein
MNGKHPIDDLFARTLRDAEATPPPAVWEGIVRERGRGQRTVVKHRSRWGLAAVLLLLLGAAGYWTLTQQEVPASAGKEHASLPPSVSAEQPTTPAPSQESSTQVDPQTSDKAERQTPTSDPSAGVEEQQEVRTSVSSPERASTGSDKNTNRSTASSSGHHPKGPGAAHASVDATSTEMPKVHKPAGDADQRARRDGIDVPKTSQVLDAVPDPGRASGLSSASQSEGGAEKEEHAAAQPAISEQQSRQAPDIHLAMLTGLVTPFANNVAPPPGPILQGDSTPAYVLKKGQLWFALQGEWATLNGAWKGTRQEVTELNESETWGEGQGLSLVVGREWLNGWSVGLGIGANKQRSRFLRREVEASHIETVVDTVWTGTAMAAQTNYTWDIVETVQTEPGVEHDFSATNSYTRLRIAPEVSYQLLRKKRFSLSARLAPVMMFDIGRQGNTIVQTVTTDSLETTTAATSVLPLNDASLDDRFPMSLAVSGGLDFRYRICERWSVSALPTFNYWMPRAEGRVPSLTMNELGGALRLRYDLRHQERRLK